MSSHAIACPQCRAALRSARPVPENRKVRCPQCGAAFTTPAGANTILAAAPPPLPRLDAPPMELPDSPLARSSPGPTVWAPALFAGVLLLGGMAVAGVYLAQSRLEVAVVTEGVKDTREADDKRLTDEKRLAEERQQLDEERRQLEEEKNHLAFARLMERAAEALAKKDYAEAEKAYGEALKLYPDDQAAKNGLIAAKTSALAAEAVTAQTKEDREKRQAEIARLLEQGKAAMNKKEFATAVRAFTMAKQLAPDDAEVRKGLEDALAAADADAGEKKKLADYQTHMDAGRAAMTAQRFEEAAREFQAALKILPGDATAAINLQTAQNRLAAGADLAKNQAAFADLIQRAGAALNAKRPDQAVPLLKEALKLAPDDKNTQKLLKGAKLDAATAQAEYNRLLALGDAAMVRQRFEEANRLYTQAAEALPGDPTAVAKARAAADAVTNRQAALVAYQRFMTQAALDMQNQRYVGAIRDFQEALRVVPGDLNATQGLVDARAALAALNRRRMQFDAFLQKGAVSLRQRQFAEAIDAYKDALKIVPNDPQATRGLSQARYGRAMTQGRLALAANNQADAIRSFEEALQEVPRDPTAMALLAQARIRKK